MKVYELILLIYSLVFITWFVCGIRKYGGLFNWFDEGYLIVKMFLFAVQIVVVLLYSVNRLAQLDLSWLSIDLW